LPSVQTHGFSDFCDNSHKGLLHQRAGCFIDDGKLTLFESTQHVHRIGWRLTHLSYSQPSPSLRKLPTKLIVSTFSYSSSFLEPTLISVAVVFYQRLCSPGQSLSDIQLDYKVRSIDVRNNAVMQFPRATVK
jgi:hypothetical protein